MARNSSASVSIAYCLQIQRTRGEDPVYAMNRIFPNVVLFSESVPNL